MFSCQSLARSYTVFSNKWLTTKNRYGFNIPAVTFFSLNNKKLTFSTKMPSPAFKFSDYHCIGFDLDNTLARYKVGNMIKMEYDIVSKYLIEKKGFSEKHLSKPIDHNFILKGLIIDNRNGNIVRIAPNGEIKQAAHGTKFLNSTEIEQYYFNGHWEPTDVLSKDPLQTWNGPHSKSMRTLLDYFDIVISLIFARVIDSIDEIHGKQKHYDVWPDILESLVYMFGRDHFSTNSGEYFPNMKVNPEKYYYKCSDKLRTWLKTLQQNGKRLFLITGAHVDFASHTAENTIGKDWRDYFDIVVCFAKKPGFFTLNRDFIALKGFTETGPICYKDLQLGGIYTHGNWKDLKKFMEQLSNVTNPSILYIGDNLLQDIYTPNVYSNCDTVTVCEELEAERKDEFADIWHPDEQFLCSTSWGSYFHYDTPELDTIWSHIIKSHSKICIPSLEYVANFPINHNFKTMY